MFRHIFKFKQTLGCIWISGVEWRWEDTARDKSGGCFMVTVTKKNMSKWNV